MVDVVTFVFLPLISLILGTLAGSVAGRWISLNGLLWLIGLTSIAALVMIVMLAGVETGEEDQAIGLSVWLPGAVLFLPFVVIMGGGGGRTLAVRVAA